MEKLIMAIMGNGKSANRYHLPYLQNSSKILVKYVYDMYMSEQQITDLKSQKINGTGNIEEVLSDSDIRLITICTPPSTHYELAKKCLLAGKNVIIEKPFCETVEEAEKLIAIAKEKGLLVAPYQNRRFDSDYLTLQKIIQQGYLGEIIELEMHVDYLRHNSEYREGGKKDGNLYALGIHFIDQVVHLFGKPTEIFFDSKNAQNSNNTFDDYFELQLFYSTKKVIIKSNQVVAIPYPRYRLNGIKGSYIKKSPDQQENDLKVGIVPSDSNFGVDTPQEYGHIKYLDISGDWQGKRIISEKGNYGLFYEEVYKYMFKSTNFFITNEEILLPIKILELAPEIGTPLLIKI